MVKKQFNDWSKLGQYKNAFTFDKYKLGGQQHSAIKFVKIFVSEGAQKKIIGGQT